MIGLRALLIGLGVITLLALSACSQHVQVPVAAWPSVSLSSDAISVVAVKRNCRYIADALVTALVAAPGLRVDPRATTRLAVSDCGESFHTEVDVFQEFDRENGRSVDRRRVVIDGRAHAVITVMNGDLVIARLLAGARENIAGQWGAESDYLRLSKSARRQLSDSVAGDLTEQLRPVPRLAHRRIYPRAPNGTARHLHSLAVLAEQQGDLPLARRLAGAAHADHPSDRSEDYVRELDSLLLRSDTRNLSP